MVVIFTRLCGVHLLKLIKMATRARHQVNYQASNPRHCDDEPPMMVTMFLIKNASSVIDLNLARHIAFDMMHDEGSGMSQDGGKAKAIKRVRQAMR